LPSAIAQADDATLAAVRQADDNVKRMVDALKERDGRVAPESRRGPGRLP
jgi:hypothetical protein